MVACPNCKSEDTTHTSERKDVAYSHRWYWVLLHECNECGVLWQSVERPKNS